MNLSCACAFVAMAVLSCSLLDAQVGVVATFLETFGWAKLLLGWHTCHGPVKRCELQILLWRQTPSATNLETRQGQRGTPMGLTTSTGRRKKWTHHVVATATAGNDQMATTL